MFALLALGGVVDRVPGSSYAARVKRRTDVEQLRLHLQGGPAFGHARRDILIYGGPTWRIVWTYGKDEHELKCGSQAEAWAKLGQLLATSTGVEWQQMGWLDRPERN